MEIPKFLKLDGDSLVFNQEGELVYYIPDEYFVKKICVIEGEYYSLIGVFDYAIFDKNGKHSGLKPFRLPTVFLAKPSETELKKKVKLEQYGEAKDYRLLKFRKGDQVIVSINVPEIVDNCEDFYRLFLSGGLPTTIPYDKLHEYIPENLALNGKSYDLNMQLFGIAISEMCRSLNDPKKPFRLSKMDSMQAYRTINIRQIPKYVSPFVSITSENWDEAIGNAVINKNTKYTPLEKLLTT